MFSQKFEEELWHIWRKKSISILLVMQPTLLLIHSKFRNNKTKTNELKLSLLIKKFENLINKNHYLVNETDDSFENFMNFMFALAAVNSIHNLTIGDFVREVAGMCLLLGFLLFNKINESINLISDFQQADEIQEVLDSLINDIKSNEAGNLNKSVSTNQQKSTKEYRPCDIFICCTTNDQFQYLDGFIKPLLIKYNFNAIYPQRDVESESIGLCEDYIAECKLYLIVITSSYYSDPLMNLFTRRALYYSNSEQKKLIMAVMDYEPQFVAHTRYMRPIELEVAEIIPYNEENINQSSKDFNAIISKIKQT